jgi:hypothetical protein
MATAFHIMHNMLRRLLRRAPRRVLTPGDLYRRMSAEFRYQRPEDHRGCVMPVIVFAARAGGTDANWRVERLASHCPECTAIAGPIASRHAARFDIFHFTPSAPPMAEILGISLQAD